MELEAGVCRIDLQIEGSRLDRFLLVTGEAGKAIGESVSAIRNSIVTQGANSIARKYTQLSLNV